MSLIKFQHLNQQIKDKLFETAYKIKCFNKSGDTDISRYAETYFQKVLNIIFKEKNWEFEKAVKINQDTYDLYDKENKVCVQITSNNRKSKKDKTIKLFEKKYNGVEFTKLILLFLTEKKPKPSNEKLSIDYEDYSIIEFANLIESTCNHAEFVLIRDILIPPSLFSSPTQKVKNTTESIEASETEFLRCIKLEEDLKKELLIEDYGTKIDFTGLAKDPSLKFKDSRFILRSIEDTTYPNVEAHSSWSRTFMYDFYERGIIIWPDAILGTRARVDEKENWYLETFENRTKPLEKGFKIVKVRILAKLPFKFIVHLKDGDGYYNDYHLYCKYIGIDNTPFEEIEYHYENSEGYYWKSLDPGKEIK